MQTEFDFQLPRGYVDANGRVHQYGRMRLATALDEIELLEHPHVKEKPAYMPIMLLARVVVQLGDFSVVTPQIIGGLFASDLAYLQDVYQRLNGTNYVTVFALCPHCQNQFQLRVSPLV